MRESLCKIFFQRKGDGRMTQTTPAGTKHHFATIGALTERGGRVTTATGGAAYCGLGLAAVGDVVTYADRSEAVRQ